MQISKFWIVFLITGYLEMLLSNFQTFEYFRSISYWFPGFSHSGKRMYLFNFNPLQFVKIYCVFQNMVILFNVPCIVENNVILLFWGSVFCICWQGQVCLSCYSKLLYLNWFIVWLLYQLLKDVFEIFSYCTGFVFPFSSFFFFFLCMFQVLVLGAYRFQIIRYSCWIEFLPLWIEFLPLWDVSLYLYEHFLP